MKHVVDVLIEELRASKAAIMSGVRDLDAACPEVSYRVAAAGMEVEIAVLEKHRARLIEGK